MLDSKKLDKTINQIWVLAPQTASSPIDIKENCDNTREKMRIIGNT